MKTAKEWSDEWQRKDFHRSLEQQFEAAQLDAFKAGAEWAAKQFPPTVKNSSSWMDGVEDMQEAILSASKEIKEIPKND